MKLFLNTSDFNNPTIEITETKWTVMFCDEYDGDKSIVQNNLTKYEATKMAKALCAEHNSEAYYILKK